ncbi:MAG: glycosyl hydrolase [Melioribacteraceae bacterium]|nr:MAG: glycosyl hydrolase [Melioribacteraceae bacterium]
MLNTVVIIPAFNEEKSMGKVISDIPKEYVSEVIVVDNNSTDKTREVAESAGATVLFEPQKGYGAACLKGIAYLENKKVEIVAFLDGDYSDYPEEIIPMLQLISEENYDFVLGSRRMGVREKGALPFQSQVGSIIAGFLINLFWGYKFTDLGPFRVIRYNKLIDMKMEDTWFGWTVEMQIKAAIHKLKTKEIPVSYRKRIGKSKVTGTVKGTVMASIIILSTIFKYALRRN